MKKRILSLVLCAAMLLSMCLFLGAGVAEDTSDTPVESTAAAESYAPAVNFTNVAPFVEMNAQVQHGPARAPMLSAASANAANTQLVTNDGVVTTKTATANDDDTYTITLTSYTTGNVTQQQTTKPTDFVLVLDQSGSMKYCINCGEQTTNHTHGVYATTISESNIYYIKGRNNSYSAVHYCDGTQHDLGNCSGGAGWYTGTYIWDHTPGNKITPKTDANPNGTQFYVGATSRLDALKTAVTNFANQVATSAKGPDGQEGGGDDVNHRVAVVGFGSQSGNGNNTELLSISGKNSGSVGVAYNKITDQNLKDVLQSMDTAAGRTMVTNAINALAASGATRTDLGVDMAKRILAANPVTDGEQRNRVVIVFTDGSPTDSNGFEKKVASSAIDKAQEIKDTGATVYSIGIFSGADATSKGTEPNSDLGNDSPSLPAASNWFMQELSSNNGTPQNPSYYLSAGDAKSLNAIFEQISDNISNPTISLGSSAYVQDTVSPYFTAPVNGTVTVSTQLAKYDASGNLTWADEAAPTGLTPEVNGKTVKVTGFDYDKNFVSVIGRDENDSKKNGTFYGRRLVVTFTVEAETAFLGGNNVPTNVAESSGVYQSDGTVVENFDQPEVNVPIKAPTLTKKDANVYYGGDVPRPGQLCSTAEYDNVMANFVTIRYETNNTVSNTKDGKYTVTMTVSPKTNGQGADGEVAVEKTRAVDSTVNVYKPEITYKDSVINLGDTANYRDNSVGTVWKHNGTEAVAADMTGTAPELTFAYEPGADAFTQDTYVQVTVKIGGTNITDAVQFKHKDCSFTGCSFDDTKGQFIVHINVFDLTIEKTGTHIDLNQTFVFKVKNNGTGKTMEVVITGPGEQTIKNLPMGSYTITEDTNWSWKYTPDGGAEKTLTTSKIKNGAATVTFKNKNNGTNWLTSLAKVINTWATGKAELKK